MISLSVNVNKIATLRNARGGQVPDVVQMALDIERFGAQGITVHPRPDGRHIRYSDVRALKKVLRTEFNVEGYPDEDFMSLVLEVKPHQVTLVPDAPDVLTSNAGWNVELHHQFLSRVIKALRSQGIRTSLFVEPQADVVAVAASVGAHRVELYTEAYARHYPANREEAIAPYISAARAASIAGLGLNAGHDLNLDNLSYFASRIPGLLEVSIGHALISDALYFGMELTVHKYLDALNTQ